MNHLRTVINLISLQMIGMLQTLGQALQKIDDSGNADSKHTESTKAPEQDAMPVLPEDRAPAEVCSPPEQAPPGGDGSERVQDAAPVCEERKRLRKSLRSILLLWLRSCMEVRTTSQGTQGMHEQSLRRSNDDAPACGTSRSNQDGKSA